MSNKFKLTFGMDFIGQDWSEGKPLFISDDNQNKIVIEFRNNIITHEQADAICDVLNNWDEKKPETPEKELKK